MRGGDRNGKWLQVLKHMVFGFLNSKTYSTAPPFTVSIPRLSFYTPATIPGALITVCYTIGVTTPVAHAHATHALFVVFSMARMRLRPCSYWLILLPTLLGTRIDGGIWLLDMALGLQPRAVNEPAW